MQGITARPSLSYDTHGRPYFRDSNGQWMPAGWVPTDPPMAISLQPPFEQQVGNVAQESNFPSSLSHMAPRPVINPRLTHNDGRDLSTHAIAKATLQPALKVGGARQKSKKHERLPEPSDFSDDSDVPSRKCRAGGGRPQGSTNFAKDDTNRLLNIVERKLPLGAKAWKAVGVSYNKWAERKGRPVREVKALEAKYKALLRTKKPTSRGTCPPEIKCAHHIEHLIHNQAGVLELSDSDNIDDVDADAAGGDAGGGDSSGDDDVVEVAGPSNSHTAVARRAPSPPLCRRRMNAPDVLNTLSKAFDPQVQKHRDAERAERSFQTTHMLSLTQQLRNVHATIKNMRTQLVTTQNRVHEVERACDRAEWKLETATFNGPPSAGLLGRASVYQENPDLVRVGGKVRYPSDDDAEKENRNPSSSSHSRHSSATFDHPFNTSFSPLPSASTLKVAEVVDVPASADAPGALEVRTS
ncbi:hypothetical protein K438DRAFT_1805553 [Mycena galopus ATCC 62051]|nr:hypothetical protein K438DRAFT_1805553 [Mycena galopus ATCC 62051]